MAESLMVGMKLKAKYADGSFYPAEIIEVSTAKKRAKAPVRVSFQGYDDSVWLALDDLQLSKKAKAAAAKAKAPAAKPAAKTADFSGLAKGMRVQAEFGGKYYAADVLTVSTAKAKAEAPVKVAFVGYDGMDEWLGADRLKSKALNMKAEAAAKPEAKKAAAKAAPSAVDYSGLAIGMKVQAEFQGTFCAAEVLTVSTAKAKAKAPVKVSFIGYDASFDEWLGADRLKSKAIKKAPAQAKAEPKAAAAKASAKAVDYSGLTKGMRIQAEYEGKFYAADVVTVSTTKAKAKAPVKVSFVGHNVEEWLGADRIKSKNLMVKEEVKKAPEKPASKAKAAPEKASSYDYSGLAKGLRVQAESGGTYYAAEVLTIAKAKANPVKVKFVGYDGLDEWINGDRIRSKMLTKVAAEPATKAKGAAKKAAATKQAEGTSKVYDYSGLEKGMRVQAETGGTFYAAEVVTVSTAKAKAKAPVKVSFVGYTSASDVWVGGDKLRSKALKTSKA
jgi:biotin carboxyl carrier protein